MKFVLLATVGMAVLASGGEVTKITHNLTGHNSFADIRVYVDGCSQDDPTGSICSIEGHLYPCCHINRGTPVRGHLTMVNKEESVENGDVVCEGLGLGRPQPCMEPEFCNGLNATCPLPANTPIQYKFGLSTLTWYHVQIGSRLERFELQSQDGKEMLSFDLHFKVL